MNQEIKEYKKITKLKNEIQNQIQSLEDEDIIKQYLNLLIQKENINQKQKDLFKKIKNEEYSSCTHLWVETITDYNNSKTPFRYHSCVKCGLDQGVIYLINHGQNLSFEQKIMYDFLKNQNLDNQITTTKCDLELALSLYNKIKENHPNIDDRVMRKYMEIALDNMRQNENAQRKEKRIKRLNLTPKFNRWKERDIVHW